MAPEGTASAILALLREGAQQAQELAQSLGIDVSAVRRHLEDLRAQGLVEAEDMVAGRGRPKKLYGLTAVGREAFPRDYALLLDLVLGKLRETQGREATERLMRQIAKDLARSASAEPDVAKRLDGLLALYNGLGFEASLERTREGVVLTQRNCIFLRAALADPRLMCECFDEGILRAALPGARVTLDGSLATGALRCRHLISLGAGEKSGTSA